MARDRRPGRYMFLKHLRVLDLTDEKGLLCGRVLAELGAEVIKVEKPGGDPTRWIGPFAGDIPDPENSLFWFALNHNKRGITLDVTKPQGQELFKRLVATADLVLESSPPGYLSGLGLGFDALSQVNPRVIMTSISPFGQSGPYRDYRASDLTLMAMGGVMYLMGDEDRPPVRVSVDQASLHAGAQAVAATLIALAERTRTGKGQHIDVSIQESLLPLLGGAFPYWEVEGRRLKRGGNRFVTGVTRRAIYPCKDGYISFLLSLGKGDRSRMTPLVQWAKECGMAGPLAEIDFENTDMNQLSEKALDSYEDVLIAFFKTRTKREVQEEAVKRGFLADPVNTVEDIYQDPQLQERGYFLPFRYPGQERGILFPGAIARCPQTPGRDACLAPRIGQDNRDIYVGGLSLNKSEMFDLRQLGVI